MAGRRIVGMNVARDRQTGGQQIVFLLMKLIMAFGQQAVDLTDRNVDTSFQKFLVNQRLCDMVLEILVKHIGTQINAEVALDMTRQGSDHETSVGQFVTSTTVLDIMTTDDQVLHDHILVVNQTGPRRKVLRMQGDRPVDFKLRRLTSFRRTGSFAFAFSLRLALVLRSVAIGAWLIELTGFDLWTRRLPLRPSLLFFELFDLLSKFRDHPDEVLFGRSQFIRR